MSKVTEVHQQW